LEVTDDIVFQSRLMTAALDLPGNPTKQSSVRIKSNLLL
jgi:hypothetical protein